MCECEQCLERRLFFLDNLSERSRELVSRIMLKAMLFGSGWAALNRAVGECIDEGYERWVEGVGQDEEEDWERLDSELEQLFIRIENEKGIEKGTRWKK